MGFLDGLGSQDHFAQIVVLTLKREAVLGKAAPDDLGSFFEPCRTLFARNTEAGEFAQPVALAETQVEPAVGEDVNGCGIFRDPNRVMQGQDDNIGPEPNTAGFHGHGGQDRQQGG